MSERDDDEAALAAVTDALEQLIKRGRRHLCDERLLALQAAADAAGETEYVFLLKLPKGRPIEGAMHIVKRIGDMPPLVSPIFGFRDREIAGVVVHGDEDEVLVATVH